MSYYTAPGTPTIRGRLSSEEIRDQWAAIELAFALLPPPVSGGNGGFSGGRWDNGVLNNAEINSSTVGTPTSPSTAHLSRLFMIGSDTNTVGLDQRAWVANTLGDWRLLKESAVQLLITATGNLVMGDGTNQLPTSANAGFFYLSTVNGIPTGSPQAYDAAVPMVYDRAANKIGVFNGTWKFTAALA